MAGVILTNVFLIQFDLRDYRAMMISEAIMAVCILLTPVLCLSNFGSSLQFGLWIVLLIINAASSGINQTMAFGFGAEIGNDAMRMNAIGQAVGGMVISTLCLICALTINTEVKIFGIILSSEAFSNSI